MIAERRCFQVERVQCVYYHKIVTYEERAIEYSTEWKGPLKDRSCTDWPCLAIFVVFMACWVGIGSYALRHGNIDALLAPTDTAGRKCGLDDGVINEPNLVSFDLTKCLNTKRKCETPQVCRKECPSNNWYWGLNGADEPLESIQRNIICETDIDVYNRTKVELYNLMISNKCTSWVLNSTSILRRCIPKTIPPDFICATMMQSELKEAEKMLKALVWGEEILSAAMSSRGPVLGLIVGGAAICLLYIFLLRWLAFPFVFLSVIILCWFFTYLSDHFYKRYVDEDETTWLALTIIFAIIAGLILLTVLCLLRRIRLACQLVKEASKAVMSILSSLVFPILPWLLHLASIVYVLIVGLYLSTVDTEETWQFRLCMAIHVIGFLWLYCFITALGEMILAATFATWYWTFEKLDVPSFTVAVSAWRTFRYHLGTVALGSLLITICRLVRYILEAVQHSAKNEGGLFYNLCGRYFVTCAQVLMKYLEKFLKFMNRNAYIVCAVYGKGLCSSASDALSLILRNVLRVVVLNNIVSWLLWLGKIGITVLMGVITWWFFTSTKYEMEYWWVPVVFVVIGAYLVANVFFGVYEVAVDTIFLCFLEDCERNDGTPMRPFYMSRQLGKLLHKEF